MKRKLCSVLLALCMVLTLLPVSAMAEGGTATSLPDAVDGVITLTEDVELTNGLNYTTDVTIVLNGHTITRTNGQKTALMITNGATMTIDGSVAGSAINGTIVVGYSTPSVTNGKLIINGGTYTATVNDDCVVQTNGLCDNCEITATNATFNSTDDTFYLAGNGTYRLENCEVNGYTGIYMKSGSLTLTNTTIKATGEYAAPVANGNGASSTGDGIILDAKNGYKGNINLSINGGSISSDNAYAIRETYTDSTATATHSITVNGGTYTSSKDAINVSEYFKKAVASGVSSISISGGTFSDLSALDYLAEGATVTVKLAADTTKDVTIPANTTVTLDLAGHKIVNSATAQDKEVAEASRKHTITNKGTLTILDSVGGGVVDNVSHGRAALYNAGTIVEIKGGKFTRSVDNSTDATSAKGNSWYVIYNAEGANITKISSGEFLALGHFSSLFCNSGTINEISGGTFTQDGFIAFKNQGTVNKISGGTFSSESESCIQNWGTIGEISDGTITAGRIGIWNFSSDTYKSAGTISRITGGNISGTTAAIRLNDYDTDYKDSDKNVTGPSTVNKANASISAGNFSGALEVNAHTVLTITGGTYSVDPSAYVVPGYVASYNGSTYTVYYPVPVTPGNTSSSTTKNPDGSTTTTTTDKTTGTVTETTVEAVLKARDGATIEDVAALRDIINKEGDEAYTTGADNALTWENSGNAITYEGKSDAALPVTTRVTYYLNGVETAPADLAGQSGRVRIRFDYTNHTRETVTVDGQEYTVCVPFTAITAVILDGDKFSNIEADNGKVMELDGTTAVLGTAIPGLADSLRLTEFEPLEDTEIPAYFEVSADVTDFSLDFTATILTPSALDDLDTGDLSDLDDLSETLDDLTGAVDELADGTGALADGVQALYDGFHEYANGVQGLNEGAEALADGLTQLYDSGTALVDGANALRDGLSAVSGAVGGMTSGDTGSNDEMMAQLNEQLAPVISNYGTTVVTDTVTDADLLASLTAAGLTGEQQQAVLGAVGAAMGKALQNDTPAMVQGVAGTVSGVLMGQLGSGISQLQTGLDQLASGSAELARGADTYVKAVGQVSQGADALAEGSAKLDDASDAMYEGLAELHDGAAELHDGVQEFSDKNTDDLSDDLGGDLRNVVRRLKAVQQAGKYYQTFSGLHNGDTGSVKFIVETAEIKK